MATDTKERILDTAEGLFAEHGFPATSMRDITNAAGVNLAAINYHFGSKESLLIAVLQRRTLPINTARLSRLDALEAAADGRPVETELLVRAFLTPLFDTWGAWGDEAPKFLRLVGRVHAEVDQELRAKFMELFDTVFLRFRDAFQRSRPELNATEVHWRVGFLIGSMAYTMMWGASVVATDPRVRREPEEVLEALVHFAVGGMVAPVPQSEAARRLG